jgi:2-oxo-4-hydroxy-4-carboxy-5-ureidoimidazoline decarboxylase
MTLIELNNLPINQLQQELFKCCGSTKWANELATFFPLNNEKEIIKKSDEVWHKCNEQDFLEAFTHHPKIGDIESLKKKFAATANWASNEQSAAATASQQILEALAKGNNAYEKKFGYIFIVCATGKTAEEMLAILLNRLPNRREDEIKIAAAQQNKITHLRLIKLINQKN